MGAEINHKKMILNYVERSMGISKDITHIAVALETGKDYTNADCIKDLEQISKDLASFKSCIDHQIKNAKQHM